MSVTWCLTVVFSGSCEHLFSHVRATLIFWFIQLLRKSSVGFGIEVSFPGSFVGGDSSILDTDLCSAGAPDAPSQLAGGCFLLSLWCLLVYRNCWLNTDQYSHFSYCLHFRILLKKPSPTVRGIPMIYSVIVASDCFFHCRLWCLCAQGTRTDLRITECTHVEGDCSPSDVSLSPLCFDSILAGFYALNFDN